MKVFTNIDHNYKEVSCVSELTLANSTGEQVYLNVGGTQDDGALMLSNQGDYAHIAIHTGSYGNEVARFGYDGDIYMGDKAGDNMIYLHDGGLYNQDDCLFYNEGNLHEATQSAKGLLSAADKTKLDGIAEGANKYILPAATSTILGGVKVDAALSTTSTNPVQNKVVNGALNEKAALLHSHTKSQITDFPSSMPASDVYAWAKAATKPSYSASEVGALSLSGGTLTSSNREVLAINSTAAMGPILRLDLNGTNVASMGCIPLSHSTGYGTFINNTDGDTGIVIGVDGKLYRHASVDNLYPRYEILDASNYNSYSPTLTGTGASGTWGINISGSADTVDGYHADYLKRGSWLGSVISDVAEITSWYTLKTITIKTKIPFISSAYMPSIYIKGYAYGKSLPVDLHLAFHVYDLSYFNYCVSTSGGWAPEVYLSTYTEDSTKYVAVTLIDGSGVYSPRLFVDYADVWSQSARYYSGWGYEGSSDVVVPTSDAVKISYTPIPYATCLGTSAANYTYSSLVSALGGKSDVGHTHAFSELTSKPTTLEGFGITGGTLTGALTLRGLNTPIVRDFSYNTGSYARSLINIEQDGSTRLGSIGYMGDAGNNFGYFYIGNKDFDGYNLRVYSDKVTWGDSTIYHSGNSNLSTVDWNCYQLNVNANQFYNAETAYVFYSSGRSGFYVTGSPYGLYVATHDSTNNATGNRIIIPPSGTISVYDSVGITGTCYASTGIYTAGYVSARGQDTSSDISLKKDLKPIDNALDYVLGTRYWRFKWKDNGEDCIGIIAQEEREREYGFLVRKHSDKYTYDYAASTALLGAALQEEDNKVERLRLRIEQLENEIKNLRYGN